jgi:alkylation response protein AidB-like acyl-CoA dehydrogenase
MTAMDQDQSALLVATLRDVLSGPAGDVDDKLADLGWAEVVAADSATATTLLFTEQGRALAATALLDGIVLDALEVAADAVCYPTVATGATPSATAQGVSGVLLRRPLPGTTVAVPVAGAGGTLVALVPAESLEVTLMRTFDPSLTWYAATGPAPAALRPAPKWPAAVAAAHRALSAELIGTAGEVLRLAVEHTSSRTQFGAPIAAFQAVRHRLADAHVAIAAAQALLDAAFVDGTPTSAAAAKAQAGRAHEQTSTHALQVCGAMGSSLEHPLHRFVSRGTVLDALLGGWAEQVGELGRMVLRTGATPLLIDV